MVLWKEESLQELTKVLLLVPRLSISLEALRVGSPILSKVLMAEAFNLSARYVSPSRIRNIAIRLGQHGCRV